MSAQPTVLRQDSLDQLPAALRADFAGEPEPPPVTTDIAQRLIETEARRQQAWDVLLDASTTANGLSSVLSLLLADGVMDREGFPDDVAGTIRLCEGVMRDLAKRLGDAL